MSFLFGWKEVMMIKAGFFHMALNCKDPINIENFYCKYLGFHRAKVFSSGPAQVVMIKSGNIYLELFKASQDLSLPLPEGSGYEHPGWRHICFSVENVDEKLKELGNDVKVMLGPEDMSQYIAGMKAVWVSDPEGNIVEFNQGYIDEYKA
jgi:glyoxylase I family protein